MGTLKRAFANNIRTDGKPLSLEPTTVTAHSPETDLQPVKADITALALREATNESSAAYNLPGQFIETFTDDTNLGTQTTCDRTSGYMETATTSTGAFSNDGNTLLLCHMDGSNNSTTITDSSSTVHSITANGNAKLDTAKQKFGATSCYFDGSGDYLSIPDHDNWNMSTTTNYTIEFWMYPTSNSGDRGWVSQIQDDNNGWYIRNTATGAAGLTMWEAGSATLNLGSSGVFTNNSWQHVAMVKEGNDYEFFRDGTSIHQSTDSSSDTFSGVLAIGTVLRSSPQPFDGYIDELRISNVARYTTTFTPNEISAINATGTLIQSANTVGSAKTKVGGTLLYKDNAGTNTLGTDLKVYMTCDGGSNWTEAASYNAVTPVYSTGVKQVRLGETTCTSGTDVRYKCEWANQASGTKEAQIHGIGLNY